MASRDEQTDSGRMGAPSRQKKDVGEPINFSSMTLGEEKAEGGWTRITEPEPIEPPDTLTAGTRD